MKQYSTENADQLCQCLKGIVHPTRIAILIHLRDGPLSVGALEDRLKTVSQSNLSQHLSNMRIRGIVNVTRNGNQIFYSVADKRVYKLIDLMKEIFCR